MFHARVALLSTWLVDVLGFNAAAVTEVGRNFTGTSLL
jgi:hypothetical protein